jgi:hypothetical protein
MKKIDNLEASPHAAGHQTERIPLPHNALRNLTLLLSWISLTGCAALASFGGGGSTTVTAERLEPGGKGLFVVRPYASDPECVEQLQSPNGKTPVDCNAEFLVGCDASAPDSKQFCTLVQEKGRARDSIYPGNRRAR